MVLEAEEQGSQQHVGLTSIDPPVMVRRFADVQADLDFADCQQAYASWQQGYLTDQAGEDLRGCLANVASPVRTDRAA